MSFKRHEKRIYVPSRMVSGGLDYKFETDSYDVELHNLMSSEQYTEVIENVNEKMRKSRANSIDGVLLATGPLILPLALWGVRHRSQTKKRKRLLKEAIRDFNERFPELVMRWNRRPESTLTIERKETASALPAAIAITATNTTSNVTTGGDVVEEDINMAHATLLISGYTNDNNTNNNSGSISTTNDHSSQYLQQQQQTFINPLVNHTTSSSMLV